MALFVAVVLGSGPAAVAVEPPLREDPRLELLARVWPEGRGADAARRFDVELHDVTRIEGVDVLTLRLRGEAVLRAAEGAMDVVLDGAGTATLLGQEAAVDRIYLRARDDTLCLAVRTEDRWTVDTFGPWAELAPDEGTDAEIARRVLRFSEGPWARTERLADARVSGQKAAHFVTDVDLPRALASAELAAVWALAQDGFADSLPSGPLALPSFAGIVDALAEDSRIAFERFVVLDGSPDLDRVTFDADVGVQLPAELGGVSIRRVTRLRADLAAPPAAHAFRLPDVAELRPCEASR